MKNNKIMFKEIVLEDTKKINGGAILKPDKIIMPPRTSGLVAPIDELIPIKHIKLLK